ncbi:MAG: DUF1512 family protein [archaeon]|nr:DUF1512 family protein [archaeon]
MMENFLGGDNSLIGTITSIIFLLFIVFYQKIMIMQTLWRAEKDLKTLDEYTKKAEGYVLHNISKKPDKKLKNEISNFMNFFISTPVDVDPYGILNKIEHVMNQSERRFNYFVDSIAPSHGSTEKDNLKFGLIGALGVYQIYKIVRHLIITIKKTNNLQMVLILQMYMPLLLKMAKGNVKATHAFIKGIPIGDAIGPMIAASFKTKEGEEIAKDVVVSEETIEGKTVFVMKAKGPGASLGKLGKAVETLREREDIDHIITIDAAGKLEGEETGSIAEGVGVMMGGIGVERSKIEEVALKHDLPLDGVAIKMGIMEASSPLHEKVFKSQDKARDVTKRLIKETKSEKILLLGVGNSCGIGDTRSSLTGLDGKLKPIWKKQKQEEKEEEKKERGWF